jgi:hypothetical protein
MAAAADPSMPGVGGQRRLRLRLLVHFSSLILKSLNWEQIPIAKKVDHRFINMLYKLPSRITLGY